MIHFLSFLLDFFVIFFLLFTFFRTSFFFSFSIHLKAKTWFIYTNIKSKIFRVTSAPPPPFRSSVPEKSTTAQSVLPPDDVFFEALQNLIPNAHFREGQLDAIKESWNKDLIFVSATGSGKTLVYEVPAALSSLCTIIVTPLVALKLDLQERLQADLWTSEMRPSSLKKFLIVSIEQIGNLSFKSFLATSISLGLIRQIVLDEVHLLLTSNQFRPKAIEVIPIMSKVRVPLLFLSATLPPSLEFEIQKLCNFMLPCLRSSTIRPNLKYLIERLPNRVEMESRLHDLVQRRKGRTIVFVTSLEDCEMISSKLNCPYFHGGLSLEEKKVILTNWKKDPRGLVVATSGFGAGINADVDLIIHFRGSHSVIEYFQETGRGGRKGNNCDCITLHCNDVTENFRPLLRNQGCVRSFLHQVVDGKPSESCKTRGFQLCSNCQGFNPWFICNFFEKSN